MTTSHDSAAWPMDVPAPGPALNTTFLVFTVRVRLHFVLALMVTINSISSSDPSLPDAGATAVPSFGRLEVATPIAFNAYGRTQGSVVRGAAALQNAVRTHLQTCRKACSRYNTTWQHATLPLQRQKVAQVEARTVYAHELDAHTAARATAPLNTRRTTREVGNGTTHGGDSVCRAAHLALHVIAL